MFVGKLNSLHVHIIGANCFMQPAWSKTYVFYLASAWYPLRSTCHPLITKQQTEIHCMQLFSSNAV